jgi:F0F1-type ATP synthase alpha subunit
MLSSTAVFFAAPDAALGTKLATLMAAAAAGERVRDEGGHALVVLDDLSPLSSECGARCLCVVLGSDSGLCVCARARRAIPA